MRHLVALIVVGMPVAAMAQPDGERWYGHSHMWDYGGFGMVFGPILWLVVLGLIVVGVVWAVRSIGDGGDAQSRDSEAMSILRSRYAKGEIDSKEFEERKRLLEG